MKLLFLELCTAYHNENRMRFILGKREAKPSFLIFPCNGHIRPQSEFGHRTATDTSAMLVLLYGFVSRHNILPCLSVGMTSPS